MASPPTTLNQFLEDVLKRHLMVRDTKLKDYHEEVFDVVDKLLERMNYTEPYKCHYISQTLFGSDMYSTGTIQLFPGTLPKHLCDDVEIEANTPGLVWLRAKPNYFDLPLDCQFHVDHFTHYWVDNKGYLLRTRFLRWFDAVVDQALNQLTVYDQNYKLIVGTELYEIKKRVSKGCCTLNISCPDRFSFDVDLFPALKFPENRWPPASGCRKIPNKCKAGSWVVIPNSRNGFKTPKSLRSWHVMLDIQETRFLHDHRRLHQTMSLIKKVRNALKMSEITDYHLRTLFLWETQKTKIFFWNQSIDFLFKTMLWRLYDAVRCRRISFFWNKKRNTIRNVKSETLSSYEESLKMLLQVTQEPSALDDLAHLLLSRLEYERLYGSPTPDEFEQQPKVSDATPDPEPKK